jgi:hypothetical protein
VICGSLYYQVLFSLYAAWRYTEPPRDKRQPENGAVVSLKGASKMPKMRFS